MDKLLIIDDNKKLCELLVKSFEKRNIVALHTTNQEDGLALFMNEEINVVILDIMLGRTSGIDLLKTMLSINSDVKVIMITGFSSVDTAVAALKYGAFDYIPKPIKFEKILSVVKNAFTVNTLNAQNRELKKIVAETHFNIITKNLQLQAVIEKAKKLAHTEIPVLIQGETGSGKELLADFIHYNSNRAHKKIHKVNCASFPESLLDNELFGHDKGAYTGATSTYKGIFERADGSTLFLDELADMSKPIQTKILRAIQNMEIRRIGGDDPVKIDVRFVAATNRPLIQMVEENLFREDLYFRLNAGTITVPPLRERTEDIPYLIHSFIEHFNQEYDSDTTISDATIEQLISYPWPGNVRELKNAINYACALAVDERIEINSFPASIATANTPRSSGEEISSNEKDLIIQILKKSNYNKKKSAEILGISRQALYNKIRRYNINTATVIQE